MASKILSFATKHAVAESSKLKSTTAGHIYNIKATADIDNGTIVGKGALVAGKLEVYTEAAATTFTGKIIGKSASGMFYVEVISAVNAYLVLSVPLIYEEYTKQCQLESNFYNEAGDILRCYEIVAGDVFALSAEGIVGTIVVGTSNVTVTAKKVTVSA